MHPIAFFLLILLTSFSSGVCWGDSTPIQTSEEIIVSATPIPLSESHVGSSVSVVTPKPNMNAFSLQESLKSIPGLSLTNQGSPGSQSSIFLRGAPSHYTAVYVDGIKMSNPVNADRSFDPAHLSIDTIERIEILRGPQSILYGSDAMAGVISITTKKGTQDPRGTLFIEGGSYGTVRQSTTLQGSAWDFSYAFNLNRIVIEGFSEASNTPIETAEKDPYGLLALSARLHYAPNTDHHMGVMFSVRESEKGLDSYDYKTNALRDDPNNFQTTSTWLARVEGKYTFDAESEHPLVVTVHSDITNHQYDNKDEKDSPTDFPSTGTFNGMNWTVGTEGHWYYPEAHVLSLNLEREYERGAFKSSYGQMDPKDATTHHASIQSQWIFWEILSLTFGGRLTHHNQFGWAPTYRTTGALLVSALNTKLRATLGSGIKNPSLRHLYDQTAGNLDLKPEETVAWDIGFETSFWRNYFTLRTSYFSSFYSNLISFKQITKHIEGRETKSFIYFNQKAQRAHGLENEFIFQPTTWLRLALHYTYTKSIRSPEELAQLRVPTHQWGFALTAPLGPKGELTVDLNHVGRRFDYPYELLSAYTLVNLSALYPIGEHFKITGRVQNIFNTKYEVVKGYRTPGFSVYLGLEATI